MKSIANTREFPLSASPRIEHVRFLAPARLTVETTLPWYVDQAVIPSGYRNGVQAELVGLVLEPGDMLELPKWQMITLTDDSPQPAPPPPD
jgi:hypothetical protein